MRQFNVLFRWGWTFLVVVTLALAGCDGDDGAAGAAGAAGDDGLACWDLNGNGVGDLAEDINLDGLFDASDCGVVLDPVAEAVEMAEVESCATCHGGIGDTHQAVYDQYAGTTTLAMEFTGLDVQPNLALGGFDLTLDFTIEWNGQPYTAPLSSFDTTAFHVVNYDSGTGEFSNAGTPGFGNPLSAGNAVSNGDGSYTLTQNIPVNPTAFGGGAIVGRIASGRLDIEDRQAGKRVAMYADLASASWPIGDYAASESAADVEACEACHGTPYRKHGTYPGLIEDGNTPAFAMCRGCHNEASTGGHPEWQHMVDDPLAWATGLAPTAEQTARYGYERTLQQDVHMSHALEFPYPQSMATCNTCHSGAKLAQVLNNSNFTMETCQGCHVIEGVDASPAYGAQAEGQYYQPHRAPSFEYLWSRGSDLSFHLTSTLACTDCHGAGAPTLAELHSGYDKYIYDANGVRYDATYTATIDSVTYDADNDTLTVDYHTSDAAVVPELLVSFYGWDTKDFLIPSHWRDADSQRFEHAPNDDSPLFTVDDTVVAPDYRVTANLSAYVAELTADIPTLIDNMDVTKIEVTVVSYIDLGLEENISLDAVTATYDLMAGGEIPDYFKGAAAIVDYESCNACHDQLSVTFHSGDGRAGEMTVCRNCHASTNPGGHLEMQSRSIEGYVHAIHSFQDFDLQGGRSPGIFDAFDPVSAKRYDQHIKHAFPYFTAQACEACHKEGTYNVPDQSKSMPGVLSDSWVLNTWYSIDPATGAAVVDPAGRNIGYVPEYVVGPASKACGACHRAELINEDKAGDLAAFNAHTDAFGTLVENDVDDGVGTDVDDEVLFGIIHKIMTLFE